jgi:hypothetical protein
MLLKSYTRDIFRADGNPSFVSVHCIARRDQDIAPRTAPPSIRTRRGYWMATCVLLTLIFKICAFGPRGL